AVAQRVCSSNPCKNGGTCLNLLGSYHCVCPSTWADANCNTDVNECQMLSGTPQGCQNGATCENTPGSFSCSCSPEWSGSLCTTRYDDCRVGGQTLCVHGMCIDADRVTQGQPRYQCLCDSGWQAPTGNAACTQDVDECAQAAKPCSSNPLVACYNTQGSYYCGQCPAGWQGNGYSCRDVDECSTNNGGCSTAPMVQCLNTMGSFHCGPCPPGYQGDGKTCTQADICAANNGGCFPLAVCSSVTGSSFPLCTCPPGFTGHGHGPSGCSQTSDLCLISNPCVNGLCVNTDECASAPCLNGGTCADGVNGFTCTCTALWTGPLCQTQQQGPSGSFSYPNTPGGESYDHLVSCAWVITTDPDKILRVSFPYFQLESSTNCNFDFLQIHDGNSASSFQIARYCGASIPPGVLSSHNALYFWFRSDMCGGELTEPHGVITSPGYPGNYPASRDCYWTHPDCSWDFLEIRDGLLPEDESLAKYSDPGCGGTFTASEGVVISPNWPNNYAANRQCIYLIRLPPGEVVALNFTHMSLENHGSCTFDYVEVRDGREETDALIGKYCGSTLPAPIRSTSNALWLRFKSDSSVQHAACGGTFSGMGQIRSPYHPNPYPHNKECEWVISQPQGYVVTLDFLFFDVEGNSCRFDFVRDGSTSSSPLLGTFCGDQAPAMLSSTQRSMYIRFKTDSSVTNLGFMADYASAREGCGGTVTTPTGTITSPGHPSPYPHGTECTWLISVAPGNLIRLTFDSFNLEYDTNCYYDYVEVYDNGTVETGSKVGRYCGRGVPPSITSTDNLLTVLFVSDHGFATEGFSSNYISINATTDCGETFTSPAGSLSSPNYPNNYPNHRECAFKIVVEVNMQIMLNFTDFQLEGSANCIYDYVEIRDGGYETSPLIGKYCGNQGPPVLVSHSNRLWVKFRSDLTGTHRGFSAHWDGTQTGCGGNMLTTSGSFSSPNYPLPYHLNAECYWRIKSSQGSLLRLAFSDFHLESSGGCYYDYLAVYDGGSTNAPRLAKLCGSQLPAPINSSHGELYVKLRTDGVITAGGFLASYTTGVRPCLVSYTTGVRPCLVSYTTDCQGVQISGQQSGAIESLRYPNTYPPSSQCSWTIQAMTGNTVNYTFTAFQLESTYACSYDYVKLYNGPNTQAPLIGTFCGATPPPANSTTGSSLTLVFRSDSSVSLLGFQMMWEQYGCTKFDVEYHPNCDFDVLEVYGGPDLTAPRLAQLCSTTSVPMQVSSTGNTLTVRFKSDDYVSGGGFNASWAESPGGCGGPVSAPYGEIHSPSYPGNYPHNSYCSWVITVDPGHRVLFNLTDLETESNCYWDYVAIYDGPSAQAPLLAQVCGIVPPDAIVSTQNVLYVRFRSDSSSSHLCGGTLVADEAGGAVASPRYPSNYAPNLNCSWIITAQEPLEILDGDNYQAPSIGRYCGSTLPHPVTSYSSALVLNFVSDSSVPKRGFRATYVASTSSCGGNLVMESGAFNSPNYPDAYPANVECVWTLTSSPGNRLQLSFIMFGLESSLGCDKDVLEVREGNSTGPLVIRLCGNALPSNYTSVLGHILWIRFRSDATGSGPGFQASFTHLYGNDLSGAWGQIASPLYPRLYPNNADYRWTVSVDGDSFIHIRFLDIDIEDLYDCYYDKLKVFDGPDVHSYPMGRFCGRVAPPPLVSTGSTLTLEFQSDGLVGGRGFLVEWTAVQDTGPLPTIAPGACGGVLMPEDAPQFLFSPGWPSNYGPDLECTWVIRSPDSTVELNLLSLDMEDYSTCYFDSLVVRDAPWTHPLHGVGGRGFNASYTRGCGGLLHADRGVLSSPHYPDNYLPGLDCSWHLMVTPGFRISVTFQTPFQVPGSGTQCSSGDYVELRNGPDASAPSLGGRLCGSSPPPVVQTTDNQLHVHFVTDTSVQAGGFKLTFEAHSLACGGFIHLNHNDPPGYITSPNYPQNYPQNIDCIWVITAPNGESVQVDFEGDFYIETTSSCLHDYLEVRDGATSDAVSMGRLCGPTRPSTQWSTGSALLLRFRTDTSVTHLAVCGGTSTGQSGVIKSPNYPGANYPDGSACEWFLEGPTGHYLTINYGAFDLQSSPDCSKDYVEVREYNATGRLLGRHCGSSIPASMDTGDSFAFVRFVSDGSVGAPGFSLYFQASVEVCGGELNDPSGTISSPNYPNLYPHSRLCRWEVIVQAGRRITLTINDLRLEGSGTSCSFDYVEVVNGLAPDSPRLNLFCGSVPVGTQVRSSGNTMALVFRTDASVSNGGFTASYASSEAADLHLELHPTCESDYLQLRLGNYDGELLAKFCGQTTPLLPIVVFTPELWVHFQTDPSEGDLGFKAKYMFSDCGGWQTGEGGVVSSPNYPDIYPGPSRCAWLLEAPAGHTITLTFSYFNLESHSMCQWDSLTIFNGGSPGSPVIGQYCGTSTPLSIQSGSNKLAVVFLADHSVSRGGFLASWTSDSSGCGGVIHADAGTIRSPGYPQDYPANAECSWRLVTHEGNHLEMSFNGDFQIPDVWSGGAQTDGALLATGCGSTAPGPVVAPYNVLTARFQVTGPPAKGFLASFTSRCGANFTAPSGRVVSPNYPADYPNRSNCNYTIDGGETTVILLTFTSFQVEAHSTCTYDGLKIYRGVAPTQAPLATLCGSTVPGPFSTFGPMLLNFYSDSVISDTGFMAEYRAICTVSSPALSQINYHHNINCSYRLMVRSDRVIDLKFNTFHLEASSSCRYDYVSVYDGGSTAAPLLGKFCGAAIPPDLRSATNQLFLLFVTDQTVSAVGWRATYSQTLGPAQGCGGYLSPPTGSFGSPDPNLDGRYEPHMDCLWTMETTVNQVINLTFTSFDLEAAGCRYDYVKVYDGDNLNAQLVGSFCGSAVPLPFVSSGNFLTVRFLTDGVVQKQGFNATYRAIERICGGMLNATTAAQTITSPFFPNAYPAQTSCSWILDAPPQEAVRVSVQSLVLQPGQSCSENYLEMKDWPMGDYGQAHKFCAGDGPMPDFYSYGRTMRLHFKSDTFLQGNGMSLTYQVAGCSRTYQQAYGYLRSPGWPAVYPHEVECEVVLAAPQGSTISLFFDSFDLEHHSDCSFDYVEVRNGSTGSSPLLGKLCGSALPSPIFPGGNQLYLRFRSDYSNTRNGYEATWTSSPQVQTTRAPTPTGHAISIDDPGDCLNNFLKLYDGPDNTTAPVGPYCGLESNIAPFTASSHHVFIEFQARSAVLPSGFRLTWSS
ncbi:hypothetical protein NHX12_021247, partial [Muraenolepis orangiensis]